MANGDMATDPLWNAAGDIAYATDDNVGTVLPIGTVGQVLTVSSGTVPAWENAAAGDSAVAFRATMSGDQTISTSTTTLLQFDTEAFDSGGYYDNSSSNYKWTPPEGYVSIYALIHGNDIDSGAASPRLYKNGTVVALAQDDGINSTIKAFQLTYIDQCDGDDYYQMYFRHTAGSNRDIESDWSYFCGHVITG